MVYCTIEEAWNQSLNPELMNQDVINNHTGYDSKYGYHKIHLEDQIVDEDGKSISCKKPKKTNKKTRQPNFSRTYNRLPEHSGPKTRFSKDNQKVYVRSSDGTQLDGRENHPSYMNLDLPINEHNYSMYEKLNDEYDKNQQVLEDSSMIDGIESEQEDKSENFAVNIKDRKNRNNDNYIHIIRELREENNKLKDMVNSLKNTKGESKDTFLDLIVFIATGIIIILMMENITKLLRKF